MEIKSLSQTLTYENDHIIYKFLEQFDISFEEATEIFTETKKWLWYRGKLIHEAEMNNGILKQSFIDEPLLIIDEMWHTFILFTKDYRLFCQNYFNTFIDHSPTTKIEKDEMNKSFEKDPKEFNKEVKERTLKQYHNIFELLGEQTLIKWYSDFPEKYSSEKIKKLRK